MVRYTIYSTGTYILGIVVGVAAGDLGVLAVDPPRHDERLRFIT